MNDIISQLKDAVSAQALSSIAKNLGESDQQVSRALDGIFPLLLGGIINKSKSSDAASLMGEVMGFLKNAPSFDTLTRDPSVLLNLATGNTGTINWAPAVQQFLKMIFGDKVADVIQLLSRFSGIKSSSVSSLLGMAIPLVTGFLGKKAQGSQLNPAGVLSYLLSEKKSIIAAAPAGMEQILGLGSLEQLGAGLIGKPSSCPAETKKLPWLPIVAILLLLLAALFFWKNCANEGAQKTASQAMTEAKKDIAATTEKAADSAAQAVTSAASNTADAVSSAAGAATQAVTAAAATTTDAAKSLWASLGDFFTTKLPNGFELNIPQFGVEKKLIDFIADAGKPVDTTTWFSFDRLLFETGSATLQVGSQEQLRNVAEIMKAYPAVDIKLGGYTDNTGDPQHNLKLSQDRSDSVKQQLVNMGIAENRVVAVGYGQEHPVASNDTEEGRAQNRRIDILVTKK